MLSIMSLYNRKRDPLKLAVDMFESKILNELDEEALLTFKEMTSPLYYDEQATEDDNELYDWSKIRNSLFFTKDCMKIFDDDLITALWVAYESLRCIFKKILTIKRRTCKFSFITKGIFGHSQKTNTSFSLLPRSTDRFFPIVGI